MNNFNRLNTISGWIAFLISIVVYALTLEPSVSLWDCGEFISASYRLQVVHPPGAPLFLMLGRLFTLFAAPETNQVAIAVNMLSATASAATVMLTFWITTHFAKKLLKLDVNQNNLNLADGISVLGAGFVGALSVTFMDTFWFSAVEAEVYAMSSAFMALAFWSILKWEKVKDQPKSDKWLVFIAYTIGLGIGIHLLNLLIIPAVLFYYFFTKYPVTRINIFKALAIGLGAIAVLQWIVIPKTPAIAAFFDKMFVNGFGLPYNSGSLFFILLIATLIVLALVWTKKNNKPLANLVVLCFAFIMMGFASYSMVVIRSMAEPAINMNDPQDAYSLLGYINREQYGDRPLVKGPYWNARPIGINEGKMQYDRTENGYEEVGPKMSYKYDPSDMVWFPRMGDASEKSQLYPMWAGMTSTHYKIMELRNRLQSDPSNQELQSQLAAAEAQKPTYAQNIGFMFKYQIGWMYWRYFMWNFAGRQNDIHNITGNVTEGNWLSGIGPVDEYRLGPQSNLPKTLLVNKARNKYYFLPLILGILGIILQYKRKQNEFFSVLMMFLFTGILVVIYLNQPPMEPRERDYSNVGSYQTFCIWIGLGVLAIVEFLKKWLNKTTAAVLATVFALGASPVLMASQNWDDHDRSDRYLGISFAKNYLNSCEKNAILFTNGDNDTYPLWYAQNVEGIRKDIRIINLSLLPTEWYSNALRKKVFDSEPLPMSIPAEKLSTGKREYLRFNANASLAQDKYYPLTDVVNWMTSDDRNKKVAYGDELMNYLPVRNLVFPVDKEAMKLTGLIPANEYDKIVDRVQWTLNNSALNKGELIVLDIISTNAKQGWKRPIYWTTTTGNSVYLGLDNYLRHNGLTYQLLPLQANRGMRGMDDVNLLYNKLMNVYDWGNMDKGKMFLDDKAALVPRNLQSLFIQVGDILSRNESHDSAMAIVDKCLISIPETILPMNLNLKAAAAEIYYRGGNNDKGDKLFVEIEQEAASLVNYYKRFRKADHKQSIGNELQDNLRVLQSLSGRANQYGRTEIAKKIEATFNKVSTQL